MKKVPVYNANGDEILAFPDAVEYYASIGWTTEKPAKSKGKATSKVEEQS